MPTASQHEHQRLLDIATSIGLPNDVATAQRVDTFQRAAQAHSDRAGTQLGKLLQRITEQIGLPWADDEQRAVEIFIEELNQAASAHAAAKFAVALVQSSPRTNRTFRT